ncbi:MAG: radical SAM protein [Ruminococcus sp.]|nr:radical SAM protein [Ruminococcus sp.]
MKIVITKIIFFFAEKFKHMGKVRIKIKSFFFPCYRFVCRVLWKYDYLYLYHVELPVTQKCSLKCEKCCFLMPYFKNPIDYKVEDLLGYIDRLFECVDAIQIFRILGGEPFLYKDLGSIIKKVLECPKVKTVDIVTNGTIIPDENILSIMKDSKLTVQVSDYGKYSRNKIELKAMCDRVGVKCVIRSEKEKGWFDAGNLENRGRDVHGMKKQMKHCGNICRSFHNGRLYFCPRASFGTKLGIPDHRKDYVDFNECYSRKQLRQKIYELNQKKYLTACNYCDEGTDKFIPIPVAEQLKD